MGFSDGMGPTNCPKVSSRKEPQERQRTDTQSYIDKTELKTRQGHPPSQGIDEYVTEKES